MVVSGLPGRLALLALLSLATAATTHQARDKIAKTLYTRNPSHHNEVMKQGDETRTLGTLGLFRQSAIGAWPR